MFRGIELLISWFEELFGMIPMLMAYCSTPWNHGFSRIGDFEFLRKPQSSLIIPRSMNLLGRIFWGYVHGVVTKLSSKFHQIWTSFTQDLTFGALLAGCLGETGLTGLSNRSDRSGI